jgi:GNAT superfamily N-acetyltransferase
LSLRLRPLRERDAEVISAAFSEIGWNKPASQYLRYLDEQKRGERDVLVAFDGNEFAGYVTVMWKPEYPPFRSEGVPEIRDLNVLPRFRRRGIATRLMDGAEGLAAKRSPIVGIGVGMTADYGAAQRMYVLRGYVPDGNGLVSSGELVRRERAVIANDDLVLYFTKRLKSGSSSVR